MPFAPFFLGLVPPLIFLGTLLQLHWLLRSRLAGRFLDRPNPRSLHRRPVPRIGGLALVTGILAAWLLVPAIPTVLLDLTLALALLSLADDAGDLPAGWRLVAHLFAAAIFVAGYWGYTAPLWSTGAVLGIVWMTNLYNFMDGSDGLAGGMTLFGFGFYGVAAGFGAAFELAVFCISVALAAAAFLVLNFHPAQIFLGDVGSIPLGFLAASIGLLGIERELWPVWFPVLVFSPFVFDATATLVRRLLRGEQVWRPHREHCYQKLVRMQGHRRTALCEYALMLTVGLTAVWGVHQGERAQTLLCLVWIFVFALLTMLIDRRWSVYPQRCDGAGS